MKSPGDSRWVRKAKAEADHPDFPAIDAEQVSIQELHDATEALLASASIPIPQFNVTFRDLTVSVPVDSTNAQENVLSFATGIARSVRNGFANIKHPVAPLPPASVLDGVSGVLRPGNTCLVLGPAGAGSSLLLKRLGNRAMGKGVDVGGQVLYNGQESLGGSVLSAHVVNFVGQEDVHTPELTVRDTLQFAADCRVPDFFPYASVLRRNNILVVARALGISGVLDTIVGNDVLRGCSGGERKRVTFAEMTMSAHPGLIIADNWSKGLDSATTLSICKQLQEFATLFGNVVVTSMGAPGTDAFNAYSHLCVLDSGKQLYFGPRIDAEAYFLRLGFVRPKKRSVPDWISTISDPTVSMAYVPAGVNPSALPLTVEKLAEAFSNSPEGRALRAELDDPATLEGTPEPDVPDDLRSLGATRSLQTRGYQIKCVGKRQLRVLSAKRKQFLTSFLINLIFGIVMGSVFWQLPKTVSGAGSRGGLIFLSMLYIGLNALSTIPQKVVDALVHQKQMASAFYTVTPYIISLLIYDMATSALTVAAFIAPLYALAGMQLGTGGVRLYYAILINWLIANNMGLFVRTLVAATASADIAQALGCVRTNSRLHSSGVTTILFVLTSGYLKSGDQLQHVFKYVHVVNHLKYGLEALLINEFSGLELRCEKNELLPPNDQIPDAFRICPVTTGEAYLADFLGVSEGSIYRLYWAILLFGVLFLFMVLAAIALRTAKSSGFAFKAKDEEVLSSASSVNLSTEISGAIAISVANDADHLTPTQMTFKNMRYSVDGGAKKLMLDVSGTVPPKQMVALMGTSGAGKTTLLDCISFRKTLGKGASQEGEVCINGIPVSQDEMAFCAGYCEQDDTHLLESTVRESVRFAAVLRLPPSIPMDQKERKVTRTLERLGLLPFSDILVKALGASELKLLTMALELVSEPLVLFLDEPTSGLPVSQAIVVVAAMRAVADSGTGLVCTIHQPSQEVFASFDQLLLLKRGGETVYAGPTSGLEEYFVGHGAPPKEQDANVADWMLDCVNSETQDWHKEWTVSDLRKTLDADVASLSSADNGGAKLPEVHRPSVHVQVRECVKRQFVRYYRLPSYNTARVLLQFVIALIIGFLYFQEIDNSQTGANLIAAVMFLAAIPSNLSLQNAVPPTVSARPVFYRELSSRTYVAMAHHVSIGVAEIPFTVVATTLFSTVLFFLVGLEASDFPYFLLALNLLTFMSVMLGVAIASLVPTAEVGMTLASLFGTLFNILTGFLILKPEMPPWWRWATWVNPNAWFLSGTLRNSLAGREFVCTPAELGAFPLPPAFSSCAEIPGAPLGIGYGVWALREGFCSFCRFPNGDVLLDNLGATSSKWLAIVALFVWIVISRVIAGVGFSFMRFGTR